MAKKKTGLIIGGSLAAAVVLGGGAYAATQFMGDNEMNLATVTPASSFVYAELDLDPSGKQKINAIGSINKLEEIVNSMETKDEDKMTFEEAVYDTHFKDIPLEEINEWSAGQMAVTTVEKKGDKYADTSIDSVTIYEIKDAEKAKATVDKVLAENEADKNVRGVSAKPHYEILDGYMVVTDTKEIFENYQAELQKGNLSETDNFTNDRKSFDDDFGYLWADVGKAADVLQEEMDKNPSVSAYSGAINEDKDELPEITGRFGGSLSFQDKSIDLTMKSFQITVDGENATDPTAVGPTQLISSLDKKTIGAIGVAQPSENIKKNWEELDKTMGKQEVAQIETMIEELTGVVVPDNWEKITGDELAVGFGLEAGGKDLTFEGLMEGDVSDAWTNGKKNFEDMGYPLEFDINQKDGVTRISNVGSDVPSETLSSHELYESALPDLDKANMALWFNIDELISAMPQDTKDEIKVKDLGVIGMTSEVVDDESVAKVRWAFK